MPKLVVMGQSPAVISIIETLRQTAQDWEITFISTDGQLPYDRGVFAKLIAHKGKEKDVLCKPEEFFKTHNVQLILDKEISRINFNRRKIFLAERSQIDYDVLIMADAPQPRLPERKGIRKIGVFHLARLDMVRRLIKHLVFTETAVVEAVTLSGVAAALAIKEAGRDVVVVMPEEKPFACVLGEDLSAVCLKLLEQKGIRVFAGNTVEDILGEGEAKAVRLKSGKILASEMVVFEDVAPDFRFLTEGDLVMTERITVTSAMRTSVANVYAVDTVMEMESPRIKGHYGLDTAIARRQGEAAAQDLLGQPAVFALEPVSSRACLEALFSSEDIHAVEEEMKAAAAPVQTSGELPEGEPCSPAASQGGQDE